MVCSEIGSAFTGAILGASGYVEIGNNVFIGMNAMITRNVSVGNNVIIGAGSVVTKDCEANGVYAGNPAHKIMDIDEFYAKRLGMQIEEAKALALGYYDKFHKRPGMDVFHEYFMIFSTEEDIQRNKLFREKIKLCGNEKESSLAPACI